MVDIALNPYFDAVLREHVVRAAETRGLEVLGSGERVATREVAEATGTSVEEAYEALAALARQGAVERERHPTGDAWRALV